jgi:hypothetical protein
MDWFVISVNCWCRHLGSFKFRGDNAKISLNCKSFHSNVINRGKVQTLKPFEMELKIVWRIIPWAMWKKKWNDEPW